jgi:uncharacterized protein (TIGR02145 family)
MYKLLLFTLALLFTYVSSAQQMAVKSFRILENDLTAQVQHPKIDQNGHKAALIKVVTTQTGFEFEGGMLGIVAVEQKTSEIWVYVPYKAKALTILHPQLGQIRGYAYPIPIEAGRTYELVLVTGTVETIVKPTEIETQWLVINSKPEGASVIIEETMVGTTPFSRKYPEGTYTYRIEYPKYHPDAGKVTLQGERKTLEVNLKPKFGSVSITSKPENGMMIYLNEENTGKTTPATLTEVTSGEQTVKLMSQWYMAQAKRITVLDNQTTRVDFTMEPSFSEITITTNPTADIFIDGARKGSGTYSERMLPGVYTVKAELAKHHPDQRQLTVMASKPQAIALNLKPQTGNLDVASTPFDAAITIDGKAYGTTPNTIKNLLVGTYTLTLTKQGYGTVTKTITIAEGKTTDINETLPSGMEVTIASTPSGAQLWVNGVSVGTTPYKATLGFGSHNLKLVNGKKEVTETINVTQGGKTGWEFDVAEFPPTGTFTDSRDGKKYRYVTIGTQVWLAENLAYKPSSGNYWMYDNNSSNAAKYGYLYDWQTAKNVCPTGWHLPSDSEWTQITDFVGSNPGTKLKAKSGWSSNGNGNDDSGFSALPGGSRYGSGDFVSVGYNGYWWSSTESDAALAWGRSMLYNLGGVYRYSLSKRRGFSVRCLRD